ncbi:hypothetical protein [Fluoribacter dumoffii]|uniref:hypothetical protein n=1 Tax=Fluoribacter dumoffii TaxID=463 RepID=UPI0012DCA262|nr:hypothetical protein [Fluoribacter dumoffii]
MSYRVVHSDRAPHYASFKYSRLFKSHVRVGSMNKRDERWNNGVGESLFGSFNQERVLKCING